MLARLTVLCEITPIKFFGNSMNIDLLYYMVHIFHVSYYFTAHIYIFQSMCILRYVQHIYVYICISAMQRNMVSTHTTAMVVRLLNTSSGSVAI